MSVAPEFFGGHVKGFFAGHSLSVRIRTSLMCRVDLSSPFRLAARNRPVCCTRTPRVRLPDASQIGAAILEAWADRPHRRIAVYTRKTAAAPRGLDNRTV